MLLIPQSSTGPAYVSLPVWQQATVPTVTLVAVSPLTSSRWRAMPKSANRIRRAPESGGGEQDVGRFDVAVQQAALVGVVEGLGDRRAEDEPAGALGQGPRRLLDPAGRRA
jgi:methyl coenzyme M reductase alpha subunit